MSVSTAPAAITNLLALITAQPSCVSVDSFPFGIFRGEPFHDQPVDDGIYIAQVSRQMLRAEMHGQTPGGMREDFTLMVNIGVFRGGDNVTDVETRIWALINAVETAVLSNRNLNASVSDAYPEASQVSSGWDAESTGRLATATVGIHCWSFI